MLKRLVTSVVLVFALGASAATAQVLECHVRDWARLDDGLLVQNERDLYATAYERFLLNLGSGLMWTPDSGFSTVRLTVVQRGSSSNDFVFSWPYNEGPRTFDDFLRVRTWQPYGREDAPTRFFMIRLDTVITGTCASVPLEGPGIFPK